ncbi:hypothetical protein BZG36_05766, partial [Bifiguratus adelaidae]
MQRNYTLLFLLALVVAAPVLLVATAPAVDKHGAVGSQPAVDSHPAVATNPVGCVLDVDGTCDRKDPHRSPPLEYFIQELAIPPIAKPFQPNDGFHEPRYIMSKELISHSFHPDLPNTTMYGYNGIHPGPTFHANTFEPIKVDWVNNLPLEHPLGYAIDPTLDKSDGFPDVRNTDHLHGAHVLNSSDGIPTSWVVPGVTHHYRYPLDQDPLTMWYHDHALGITRINVYTGLAGMFFLYTPGLDEKLGLPTGKYEIPLVLQDKFFNEDGSLYWPTIGKEGKRPVWVSDFEGDTPIVNGKVAPYFQVEPRKYRFRILNGGPYREWNLYFKEDNLHFTHIGGDGGFLPKPLVVNEVPLGVAERADVIVDFAGFNGKSVFLRNNAARHESDFQLPKLLRFDVLSHVKSKDRTPIASRLPFHPQPLCIRKNRTMTLRERDEMYLLNNRHFEGPVEIRPVINTTEIWRIINLTNETHPVHIHLGEFSLIK